MEVHVEPDLHLPSFFTKARVLALNARHVPSGRFLSHTSTSTSKVEFERLARAAKPGGETITVPYYSILSPSNIVKCDEEDTLVRIIVLVDYSDHIIVAQFPAWFSLFSLHLVHLITRLSTLFTSGGCLSSRCVFMIMSDRLSVLVCH